MLSAITAFFKVLPEVIKIIQWLLGFLRDYEDGSAQKDAAKKLHDALQKAHDTNDTSSLENIFNPKP